MRALSFPTKETSKTVMAALHPGCYHDGWGEQNVRYDVWAFCCGVLVGA
jgi:hypothetical protein